MGLLERIDGHVYAIVAALQLDDGRARALDRGRAPRIDIAMRRGYTDIATEAACAVPAIIVGRHIRSDPSASAQQNAAATAEHSGRWTHASRDFRRHRRSLTDGHC